MAGTLEANRLQETQRLLYLINKYKIILNNSNSVLMSWYQNRGPIDKDLKSLLLSYSQRGENFRSLNVESILKGFRSWNISDNYRSKGMFSILDFNKLFLSYSTNCLVYINEIGEIITIPLNSKNKLLEFMERNPKINEIRPVIHETNNSSMSWEEFCIRQALPESLVHDMKEKIKLFILNRDYTNSNKIKLDIFTNPLDSVGSFFSGHKGYNSFPFNANDWLPDIVNPDIYIYKPKRTNLIEIDMSFNKKTMKLLTIKELGYYKNIQN